MHSEWKTSLSRIFSISLFLFLNLMLTTIHYKQHYERQSSLKKKTNCWLLCILRANIVYAFPNTYTYITYICCKTYIRIYYTVCELRTWGSKLDVFNANQTQNELLLHLSLALNYWHAIQSVLSLQSEKSLWLRGKQLFPLET